MTDRDEIDAPDPVRRCEVCGVESIFVSDTADFGMSVCETCGLAIVSGVERRVDAGERLGPELIDRVIRDHRESLPG